MQLSNRANLFIGTALTIIGTLSLAYFWGTGDHIRRGGDFFLISCLAIVAGPVMILEGYGIKSKEIKMAGPGYLILVALILNLFTYQYLKPTILSEGTITNGIVTGHYMDDKDRITTYEYQVNGIIYSKADELGNKKTDEQIKVAYLNWRPDYHLVVRTRKKSR